MTPPDPSPAAPVYTSAEAVARAICKAKGRNPDECVLGSGGISAGPDGQIFVMSKCYRYAWQDELTAAVAAIEAQRPTLAAVVKERDDARAELARRDRKRFPIMGGPSIPWAVIEPCDRQAQRNHGQTLRRLAERGGLSPCEAVAVLLSRDWQKMPDGEALKQLAAIVKERDPDTAPRQLAEARAALHRYALHEEACPINDGPRGEPCSCGLSALLSGETP